MEQTFQLKGKLFTLSVLQVESTNLGKFEKDLRSKIKLAPNFFNNTPIVVDLHKIENNKEDLDILALQEVLKNHKLIPVGYKCTSEKFITKISNLQLPIIKEARATAQASNQDKLTKTKGIDKNNETILPASRTQNKNTVIIENPVRSGQQIHAPDGDLIILSSVSPGAELIAEGSIHVYGALRGRALAGLNGDTEARVFCKKLEADLVSIAGQYKLFEEPIREQNEQTAPKQIYLKNGQLIIDKL